MPVNEKYPWNNDFEVAAVRQLFADPVLFQRVVSHLQPDRLNDETAKLLVTEAVTYWRRTQRVPTEIVALQELRGRVASGAFPLDKLSAAAQYLEDAEEHAPADSHYVQEQVLGEARKVAVWKALEQGLQLWKNGDYNTIQEMLTEAAKIGTVDMTHGSDYGETLVGRTDARRAGKQKPRLGTGITDLDDMLRGGLAAGELGVILGAPKFGKSMMLNTIAHHVMSIGGNVLYFSMEMGEEELLERMDAAISEVAINSLQGKADYVQSTVDEWLEVTKGQFHVKQFPSYSTTAKDLELYMQMVRAEKGFEPSLIIFDSGDLMGASRDSDSQYLEQGNVYSELRGLLVKYKIPGWTASWANRSSLDKKVVTMADIAESFRKVAISDVGIAISGTEEERQDGLARLYVAYCRFASGGVTIGPFKTHFASGLMWKGGGEDPDAEDIV